MYDFLKNIAEENDWGWVYGRRDYQNLERDMETGKVYLFVDPINRDSSFSDNGNETVTFSGYFSLCLSSDIDEEYEDKYNQYIKPIITTQLQILKDEFACSNFQINLFNTTEVINAKDVNADGIIVNYKATLLD